MKNDTDNDNAAHSDGPVALAHPEVGSATTSPEAKRRAYAGPACPNCSRITLLSPCACPGCDGWAIVCSGCPDVVNVFVASGGFCEGCRTQ